MWDLSRLRIKPVSPSLAGGFFRTEPPGKLPAKLFLELCCFFFFFFSFIFISWRLITSQHCSGFCHTLTWTSHGFTCIPHPDPPLPPPSLPDSSGSSQCTRPKHLSHASHLGWWSVSLELCFNTEKYHGFDRKLYGHPSDREEGKKVNFMMWRKV